MSERDAIVAVTDADREAAAGAMSNVWATGSSHSDFMRILDGRLDQHWSVQAFARHRATHAAEVERLREALKLAANRLARAALDHDVGSSKFYEVAEWGEEARQALEASR